MNDSISSSTNRKSVNLLDESIDDFQQNFKLIKENKLKIANISKYLVPKTTTTTTTESTTSSSLPSTSAKVKNKKSSTGKISKYFSTSNNESPKTTESIIKSSKQETVEIENKSTVNSFPCPLCKLDLTNEEEQTRQLHVNKCLDKFSKTSNKISNENNEKEEAPPVVKKPIEKEFSEEEKAKILASKENADKKLSDLIRNEGIPNCPICGKITHTLNVCILNRIFKFIN